MLENFIDIIYIFSDEKIILMWLGLLIWEKIIFKEGNFFVELIRFLDCFIFNNICFVLIWIWGLIRERVGFILGLIDICLWLLW